MNMKRTFQIELRQKLRWFFVAYVLLGVFAASTAYVVDLSRHRQIARIYSDSVHNQIQKSDIRTAVETLSVAAGASFQRVSFFGDNGDLVFSLPTNAATYPYFLSRSIDMRISPAGSGTVPNLKRLTFDFPRFESSQYTVLAWLLFFPVLWPISKGVRSALATRHERDLEFERYQSQVEVARQVSHDLRSPLTAIQMVSHRISGDRSEELELLKSATIRIQEITDDLFVGGVEPALDSAPGSHVYGIGAVINEIVLEKRVQRPDIQSLISSSFEFFTPSTLSLSREDLARIVSNLLDNSIHAVEGKGTFIRVSLRGTSERPILIIQDDGCGMTEEVRRRAGEKGYTTKSTGSGRGLSFAIRIIQEAGGRVEINSKENVGTEVLLYLR